MVSGELTLCFSLLACAAFALPVELHESAHFYCFISSPCAHGGVSERLCDAQLPTGVKLPKILDVTSLFLLTHLPEEKSD